MIGRKTLKQILIGLIGGILILSSCRQVPAGEKSTGTATPVFLPQDVTATPSPILTTTNTSLPTLTPTASIIPLPTIPTFTPTFDASTIVTVTPAPKAECPTEDLSVVAKFATPNSDGSYEIYRASDILDYLNSGGTSAQLSDSGIVEIIDLTNDGVNEVVYEGLLRFGVSILGCKDGKYQDFLDFGGDSGVNLIKLPDLNKNGTPEIMLSDVVHYGYVDIFIFEWNGDQFRSLINMGKYSSTDDTVVDWVSATWISDTAHHKLKDINGDGLKDIVVVYDVHQRAQGVIGGFDIAVQRPLRDQTIILSWNGRNFVNIKQGTNDPTQYRFQAIQDGDEQVRYGNYTAALSLYQAAIFDDRLEWWSPERREYELFVLGSQYEPTPTVYPTPIPDASEYPRLAAYAYYRTMLLHIVQGHESDAGTVHKTLQQKFSSDPYAQSYIEMANAFWNTYQSTHKIYDGCAAAIQYAVEHPEILIPLGSDYHGGYSHTYVPTDVCPFR